MSQRKRELRKKMQRRNEMMAKQTRKSVQEENMDVLQNIEFGIVKISRENSAIDDAVVYSALKCALKKTESDDPLIGAVIDVLRQFREIRDDVSDSVWDNCLSVVMDSVQLHSVLTPGAKGYLDFVKRFII
jgi:hypothetical protein